MSATRLLVLGVVRMHGQAHGYQVRRDLLTWSADKWGNVAPGSIYHALKQMTKEGLLAQVGMEGAASGPERTGYRLTPDGETEFQLLLARSLTAAPDQAGQHSLSAAITFLTALPRQRAISLLRHRITVLEGERANARGLLEEGTGWGQPEHVSELYRLWLSCLDAMIRWTDDLVGRLEAGKYVMADDSPDHFGACPIVIKLD
ncbi:MAG TPA: PadR family transcriptional regulator [Actinophytocola sp.]|uniref:PadR family transcriptional regulator n=1 Tax=Actinophytocola sp. TaxID=1872138 RepID=UPI002DDD405A|nr:PadR family transcriptional regulator [Actinophytocola sp.]HEV2778106.1 PadR family transcriptional regulator [Actinophytocola sp.]